MGLQAYPAYPEGRVLQRFQQIIDGVRVSRMLSSAQTRWQIRHHVGVLTRDLSQTARWSPRITMQALIRILGRSVKNAMIALC